MSIPPPDQNPATSPPTNPTLSVPQHAIPPSSPSSSLTTVLSTPRSPTPTSITRVSFDPKFYPHLFDTIIVHFKLDELIPLRGVSRFTHDKIDHKLSYQIVMVSVNKRAVACLPLSPPRPVPMSHFWKSNLKKSTTVVDYARLCLRAKTFPKTLGHLHVDLVRTFDGPYQGVPFPHTREWVSWFGYAGHGRCSRIPDVVKDQVTLVMKDRPPLGWQNVVPGRPLQSVVIMEGYWWIVDHDNYNFDFDEDWDEECACASCRPWLHCQGDCDICEDMLDNTMAFLFELADHIISRCLSFLIGDKPTVTLVGLDDCLTHVGPSSLLAEARTWFLELVNDAASAELDENIDFSNNVEFLSIKQYRDRVGSKHYNLQTGNPYLPL